MASTLVVATTCGAVGGLFTMSALFCGQSSGRTHVGVSPLCAALGTAFVVVETQSWIATTLTSLCAAAVIGLIWRSNVTST